MFRELSQKIGNIMSLSLVVFILCCYCVAPVAAAAVQPDIEYIIEIEEENTISNESITEDKLPQQSIKTEVESEVIDECFDDAQYNCAYKVPSVDTGFKSYTCYTLLSKQSTQWRLQQLAYTDENGLRKIGDYYLAAMGSYYSTTIGDLFKITTDTGATFTIILCDVKANAHTDRNNMYTRVNNCMVEFYIDLSGYFVLHDRNLFPNGDPGTLGVLKQFSGKVIKVESLGHYDWE